MRHFKHFTIIFILALFAGLKVSAQASPDDILNILIAKGTITQEDADSIRADNAIKAQDAKAKQKNFPVNAGGKGFQISGYTQVRYQYFQKQTVTPTNGFDIRRARLDFTGSFDSKFDYRLQADFGGTAPTLIDAYIVYKPFGDYLKFTAGQFYVPFSLENVSSDKTLELIDRSQVVNALGARKGDGSNGLIDSVGNQNGRDIGLQASGSLFKYEGRNFLDYYVAILNGSGINVADNNKYKDISSRLVLHPFSFLDLGGSYYVGNDLFSGKSSSGRYRWGAELAFNYKAFALRSEIINGQDGNNPLGKHIDHEGGYIQASYYFLPKRFQAVLKYDTYNPNTLKAGGQSTYYIAGVNYYFNSWAKIQLDYRKADGKGLINSGNDLITTQLQIGF